MKRNKIRAIKALLSGASRLHFSQYGEDVFLHKRFRKPSNEYFYVDIGAHHPYHLSNTVYLWSLGWRGVNVDASQAVIQAFNSSRPDDINLQAAVVSEQTAAQNSTITFYSGKDIDNCATCDADIARERGLTRAVTVPCTSLGKIIEEAQRKFPGRFGLLNIDIEGLDDQVIENLDAWGQKPLIVMVEIYGRSIPEVIETRTYKLLLESGYAFTERMGHTAVFELLDS